MANCYEEQPPPESFQEIEEGGFESGDIRPFQMLHLNSTTSAGDHHHQFTAVPTSTSPSDVLARTLERCTSCGSIKRRSPSSSSSLQEPPAKRAAIHHPATTNAAVGSDGSKNESLGCRKVPPDNGDATFTTPVKPTSWDTNRNVLNRSVSDITSYMGTQETGETNANVQALDSQSGENSKINPVSPSQSPAVGTLPPLPPALRRSTSAPIPSDCPPVADSTPSRVPSASRTFISSPGSDQESSASKRRLSRIKERMKQMNQWVQKVVSEEEMNEDICSENDNTNDKNPQKMSGNKRETRSNEEAVWVEESGENLIVHIKCPCGRRYEISLFGKKCYYRLM